MNMWGRWLTVMNAKAMVQSEIKEPERVLPSYLEAKREIEKRSTSQNKAEGDDHRGRRRIYGDFH